MKKFWPQVHAAHSYESNTSSDLSIESHVFMNLHFLIVKQTKAIVQNMKITESIIGSMV